jgi:hypothetical protein
MSERVRCDTCRYWDKARSERDRLLGKCRRAPPGMGPHGNTLWPNTSSNDWCGSWSEVLAPTPREVVLRRHLEAIGHECPWPGRSSIRPV